MAIEYACNLITKTVERRNGDERHCTMHESCDVTAPSIALLVAALDDRFYLDMREPNGMVQDSGVLWLDHERFENAAGEQNSGGEWVAEYEFRVVKREILPIEAADLIDSGVEVGEITI